MTPLDLKLNQILNIVPSKNPEYIFSLDFHENLLNHFGGFHAAVIFSLAEATSAQFLLQNFEAFQHEFIPLLRSTQTKYKQPAFSAIYAKADFKNTSKELVINDLQNKKRALVTISVTVHDEEEKLVYTSELEWFLTLKTN
jgi:acyl-coenzyme A thioesterase PaaI-like protein